MILQEMDTNGSGTVSAGELRDALRKKGTRIPDDELLRLMQHADVDGNGIIDYEVSGAVAGCSAG